MKQVAVRNEILKILQEEASINTVEALNIAGKYWILQAIRQLEAERINWDARIEDEAIRTLLGDLSASIELILNAFASGKHPTVGDALSAVGRLTSARLILSERFK